jgi:hypothetical protein
MKTTMRNAFLFFLFISTIVRGCGINGYIEVHSLMSCQLTQGNLTSLFTDLADPRTLVFTEIYTYDGTDCAPPSFTVLCTAELGGSAFYPSPIATTVSFPFSANVTNTYHFPDVTLTSLTTLGPTVILVPDQALFVSLTDQ